MSKHPKSEIGLFAPEILRPAVGAALRKLDPRKLARNPVIFATALVALVTTVLVLLRWGDRLFADSPEFDPTAQTAEAQRRQFGYNNDFVGFVPLEGATDRGLLCVNHEYTNEHLMFPGIVTVKDGEVIRLGDVAVTARATRMAKRVASVAVVAICQRKSPNRSVSSPPAANASSVGNI